MILTGHQPAYLPWLGYFEKIMRSDVYIYMDTVQFEKGSFTTRNKIKTANGPTWLTVPVRIKGHMESRILDLKINDTIKWQKKHFRTIQYAYKNAPYYDEFINKIAPFYEKEYSFFADYCFDYTKFWLSVLNIDTQIVRMKDIEVSGAKSDLVLSMCKAMNADTFISGAMGKEYMDEEKFAANGIKIIYQDYKPQEYPQLWGRFLPCMGIIDFVMNTKDYTLIRGE